MVDTLRPLDSVPYSPRQRTENTPKDRRWLSATSVADSGGSAVVFGTRGHWLH